MVTNSQPQNKFMTKTVCIPSGKDEWTMESAELAPLASFEELKQGFPTLPFSLAKVPSISKLAADKASVGRVSSPRLCPTFAFCCSSLDGWQDSQLLGLGIKP